MIWNHRVCSIRTLLLCDDLWWPWKIASATASFFAGQCLKWDRCQEYHNCFTRRRRRRRMSQKVKKNAYFAQLTYCIRPMCALTRQLLTSIGTYMFSIELPGFSVMNDIELITSFQLLETFLNPIYGIRGISPPWVDYRLIWNYNSYNSSLSWRKGRSIEITWSQHLTCATAL